MSREELFRKASYFVVFNPETQKFEVWEDGEPEPTFIADFDTLDEAIAYIGNLTYKPSGPKI